MEIDRLLSDEFIAYAEEMKQLHAQKQAKKQELKVFYEKIQAEIQALNEEALRLTQVFEAWKANQVTE
jgi:hypothetical protein